MPFQATYEVTALRQKCAGQFAKKPPKKGAVLFSPDAFDRGVFTYVNPDNHSEDTADAGEAGEWAFGEKAVLLLEIRAFVGANNIQAFLENEAGTTSIDLTGLVTGNSRRYDFDPPLPVLPGERIRMTSAGGSGEIVLYVVKSDRAY